MINKIKKNLLDLKGKRVKLTVDIGRNKYEECEGVISDLYENVWILKTDNSVKSFTYKDILIGSVIIRSF